MSVLGMYYHITCYILSEESILNYLLKYEKLIVFIYIAPFPKRAQCLQWLWKKMVISVKLRHIFPLEQLLHPVDANVTKIEIIFMSTYLFLPSFNLLTYFTYLVSIWSNILMNFLML